MKRMLSLSLAILLPLSVLAQANPAPAAPAPAAPAPAAALPPVAQRPEGSAATIDRGLGPVNAPDTYVVRPGDTLWDLSGRFLNNPWYWPKVWSFNPEIDNPHWIEPGNVLRFYRSTEEAPARVESVAGAALSEEPAVEAPRELDDFSRADMKAPVSAEDEEEVTVSGPNRIGYVAPRGMLARRDSFVTQREVDESGSLVAAFSEKIMLSTHDKAYARFKGAAPSRVGETYLVYRTSRAIDHPVTGQRLGYQTTILGTARVVAVDAKAATVVVGQTYEPIERGDLLGPWTEKLLRPVAMRPNARSVKGLIVAAQIDIVTQVGENHVVYVNRGKADGVEEGNVFTVVRNGDPLGRDAYELVDDRRLPEEAIGSLLVIDVKETVSTALVTRSLNELLLGDRVEMRTAAR
jgi:hypothetical protein